MEHLVERALERQLPAVLSRWAPSRRESEGHSFPTTGGSKLHLSPTVSPLGDACSTHSLYCYAIIITGRLTAGKGHQARTISGG